MPSAARQNIMQVSVQLILQKFSAVVEGISGGWEVEYRALVSDCLQCSKRNLRVHIG